MKRESRFSISVAVLALMVLNGPARACTACMGDSESNFAEATNAAIFLMLGLIGGVLGLLSVFAIYLHRRALAPLPPHAEVANSLESHPEGTSF